MLMFNFLIFTFIVTFQWHRCMLEHPHHFGRKKKQEKKTKEKNKEFFVL